MTIHASSFLGNRDSDDQSVDSLFVVLERDNNDDTTQFDDDHCKCVNAHCSERASCTETESMTNSTMSSFSIGDEESPRRRSPRIRVEEIFDGPEEEDRIVYDTDHSSDHKKLRRFKHQNFSYIHNWKFRTVLQFTCAFLAFIYLALRIPFKSWRYSWPLSSSPKWRLPTSRAAFRLLNRIGSSSAQNTFTILLSGSRVDLLHQSLQRHAYCDSVSQVQIQFRGNDESNPDFLMNHDSGKVTASSVKITTDGVLLLDEHVRLTCNDLDRSFNAWKRDPARFVGILPHATSASENKAVYSLVSDDAAFVHRLYMPNRLDGTTLASSAECADFALSVFVSAISKKNAILVMAQNKMRPKYVPSNCPWELSHAAGVASQTSTRTRFIGSTY